MKTSTVFVMYGGSSSKHPNLGWQRMSIAMWKTLKQIGDVQDEVDCQEVFFTLSKSP